jgi:hypothetical protein
MVLYHLAQHGNPLSSVPLPRSQHVPDTDRAQVQQATAGRTTTAKAADRGAKGRCVSLTTNNKHHTCLLVQSLVLFFHLFSSRFNKHKAKFGPRRNTKKHQSLWIFLPNIKPTIKKPPRKKKTITSKKKKTRKLSRKDTCLGSLALDP